MEQFTDPEEAEEEQRMGGSEGAGERPAGEVRRAQGACIAHLVQWFVSDVLASRACITVVTGYKPVAVPSSVPTYAPPAVPSPTRAQPDPALRFASLR